MDQDADQWQQHLDVLERERYTLDCLVVIYRDGREGTADFLAGELKLSEAWKHEKRKLAHRIAA